MGEIPWCALWFGRTQRIYRPLQLLCHEFGTESSRVQTATPWRVIVNNNRGALPAIRGATQIFHL